MFVLEKDDGELDPDARKEGGHVKTDAETGAMQVRPEIHLEPPEAGRAAGFSRKPLAAARSARRSARE